MRLELLAKDPSSGKTGCAAVYRPEDAMNCVVQGNQVDSDTAANLQNVLPGETAVSIPIDVLREALRAIDG